MPGSDTSRSTHRRQFLQRGGAVVATGVLSGVAGCTAIVDRASAESDDGDENAGTDDVDSDVDRDRESWPTYQYDAQRTGDGTAVTGPAQSVRERWRFDFDGLAQPPTVHEGTVVFLGGATVYGVDTADGTERWQFRTERGPGGLRPNAPTIHDGVVYVGTHDGFYALDLDDGSERWHRDAIRSAESPAVTDDTVYVTERASPDHSPPERGPPERSPPERGPPDHSPPERSPPERGPPERSPPGRIHALDPDDGETRWSASAPVSTSPAVAGGRLYFGGGFELFALDAATGDEVWDFETRGFVAGMAVHEDTDTLYATTPWYVHALDTDGRERWAWEGHDEEFRVLRMLSAPSVTSDGVYVSGQRNHYALDHDGEERWRSPSPFGDHGAGMVTTSPVAGDTVYLQEIGPEEVLVRGLHVEDGDEQWASTVEVQRPLLVPFLPPAIADRTLYVGFSQPSGAPDVGGEAPRQPGGAIHALDDG